MLIRTGKTQGEMKSQLQWWGCQSKDSGSQGKDNENGDRMSIRTGEAQGEMAASVVGLSGNLDLMIDGSGRTVASVGVEAEIGWTR